MLLAMRKPARFLSGSANPTLLEDPGLEPTKGQRNGFEDLSLRGFLPLTCTWDDRSTLENTYTPVTIIPSNEFLEALIAPYEPVSEPLLPHDNILWDHVPSDAVTTNTKMTDMPTTLGESSISIVSMNRTEAQELSLYTPDGAWSWKKGLPIKNVEVLQVLAEGSTCFVAIKRGVIGEKTVTYVSKVWPLATKDEWGWKGCFSEIALYQSETYLRPLQGRFVPTLIGVHMDATSVSIDMELPHQTFWMEASPDMPVALKEKCIHAFRMIHSRGVLHGDIEFHNMLINADGEVMIIDFRKSRALVPRHDVGLQEAEYREFPVELRKILCKLDYNGAYSKESRKIELSIVKGAVKEWRKENCSMLVKGKDAGSLTDQENQPPSKADLFEPTPSLKDFRKTWKPERNDSPIRFVVPGTTQQQLEDVIQEFRIAVLRMDAARLAGGQHALMAAETDWAGGGRCALDAPRESATRRRGQASKSIPLSPLTNKRCPSPTPSPPQLPPPIVTDPQQLAVHQFYDEYYLEYPRSTFSGSNTGRELPRASTPPQALHVHVKARDYASCTPKTGPGPRYVPNPPLENRISIARYQYIQQTNEQRCKDMALAYYDGRVEITGSYTLGAPPHGCSVSLGNLKRKRGIAQSDEKENQESKKMKVLHETRLSRNGSLIYGVADDHLSLGGSGPRLLSHEEYLTQRERRSRTRTKSTKPRGILRRPQSTIRPVSDSRPTWHTALQNTPPSPRKGPQWIPVPPGEERAITNTFVHPYLPSKRKAVDIPSDDDEDLRGVPVRPRRSPRRARISPAPSERKAETAALVLGGMIFDQARERRFQERFRGRDIVSGGATVGFGVQNISQISRQKRAGNSSRRSRLQSAPPSERPAVRSAVREHMDEKTESVQGSIGTEKKGLNDVILKIHSGTKEHNGIPDALPSSSLRSLLFDALLGWWTGSPDNQA